MSIAKNYLYNTIYNVLNIFIPLVTAPYLARVLGTEGVGVYSFYFSIAQYFTLFAKLGLTNYGTRHLAAVRDDQEKLKTEFSVLYTMQVMLTIVVFAIYILFVIFIAENKIVSLLFSIWIISVAFDIDWLLFALEDFKSAAIRNCFIKGLSAVLIFAVVKTKNDVWIYVLITAVSYALGYFCLWLKSREYLRISKTEIRKIRPHLKPCFVLLIPVIALSIYRSMDKVFLGIFSNMEQVGLFEYAEKIIYCLTTFIASFGQVMMPRMSNIIAKKDENTCKELKQNSMIFVMFLSIGMCFGLNSISDSLVPILFGKEFNGSIVLMKLLSITLISIAWGNVIRSQYIIPYKRDNIFIYSISIGAILNVISNIILVPMLGAVGSCLATIIAEFSVPVFQAIMLKKDVEYKKLLSKTTPFLIFGFVMYLICEHIERIIGIGYFAMFMQIIVGGLFYFVTSLLYVKKIMNIKSSRRP